MNVIVFRVNTILRVRYACLHCVMVIEHTCLQDKINMFLCTCVPGFKGVTCEININECASSPCLNKGTCIDGING